MYTQWLDIINCDWCNLSKNQRKSKLSTAVRDISDFWNDQEYLDLRADIDEYVRQSGAALVNVRMSDLEYPETYEW